MQFFDVMHLVWAAIFLFIGKAKSENEPENATDVMERTDTYLDRPSGRYVEQYAASKKPQKRELGEKSMRKWVFEFRCFVYALKDLNLKVDYPTILFVTIPHPKIVGETIGCLNVEVGKKQLVYPPLTGRDPMMEFYIEQLYLGMEYATTEKTHSFSGGYTPLTRRKGYCNGLIRTVPAFPEYWETFHSDDKTCLQMMEIVKSCHVYRQIRESYNSKVYEKLCLNEEGCYNVMEYYAEDLPYCVKYTAIAQFKNASIGSWHHSIINYCHLRQMVPDVTEAKYEQSILKGKTKSDLTKMCLYLKHRLLPEEGKETEMPDPDEIDYPDAITTPEYGNGISETIAFWIITHVIIVNA